MIWLTMFALLFSIWLKFFIRPLANFIGIFSDSLNEQLQGRHNVATRSFRLQLAQKRRRVLHAVVFYCSSAGEYEQAKPVLNRLEKDGVFTHTFFFSRNGFDYAVAKNELASFSLAPWDFVWTWAGLFAALQPNYVIVVRHEFWPSFLLMARRWSQIVVLNGVPPSMKGREIPLKTAASSLAKKILLGPQAKIFTSDHLGTKYFNENLGYSNDQVYQIGDTKFDRVIERVSASRGPALAKADEIRNGWKINNSSEPELPVFVLGSAHPADIDFVLRALSSLSAPKFRLVVVPHDISSKNLNAIEHTLCEFGRSIELMSDVEVLILDHMTIQSDTILVDSIGRLSELYALGDLVWVGGAVHAKIHNVLEPAAWGLPLSCGPFYQNSQEAILLVEKALLVVPATLEDAASVWRQQLLEGPKWRERLTKEVSSLAGASDQFMQALAFSSKIGFK